MDHERGLAFTGDTLFVRGCGRTDFQGGDAGKLYDGVYNFIFTLPDHFRVLPAHDFVVVCGIAHDMVQQWYRLQWSR